VVAKVQGADVAPGASVAPSSTLQVEPGRGAMLPYTLSVRLVMVTASTPTFLTTTVKVTRPPGVGCTTGLTV
jgi:hypothetical protein